MLIQLCNDQKGIPSHKLAHLLSPHASFCHPSLHALPLLLSPPHLTVFFSSFPSFSYSLLSVGWLSAKSSQAGLVVILCLLLPELLSSIPHCRWREEKRREAEEGRQKKRIEKGMKEIEIQMMEWEGDLGVEVNRGEGVSCREGEMKVEYSEKQNRLHPAVRQDVQTVRAPDISPLSQHNLWPPAEHPPPFYYRQTQPHNSVRGETHQGRNL